MEKTKSIISLGSNWGSREYFLEAATKLITEKYTITAKSPIITTSPFGYIAQPNFLNQLIEIETENNNPTDLLQTLQKIENLIGRNRNINKGPRVIDLDIITFGSVVQQIETLTLPHPAINTRPYIQTLLHQLA